MRPRRPHRRTPFALLATAGLASIASQAHAQEPPPPPPPMEIPTAPVSVPTALPPTTPPPPPRPPAAKPATTTSAPKADKDADKNKDADKDADKDASAPVVNNEGTFRISGSGSRPAAKGKAGAKRPAEQGLVAQWPGFHLTSDGGSEVMVEFSKALPAPVEHRAKGSITYVFKGARLTKSNNANPLITVHFNTPIAVARLVPKGNEVHLVIELRGGLEALPSTGIRPGIEGQGAQFFAKFAPGHFIDEAAEGDEVPFGSPKKLKADAKKDAKKSDTPPSTAPTTPPSTTGAKTGPQP